MQKQFKVINGLSFFNSKNRQELFDSLPVLTKEKLLNRLYHEHVENFHNIISIYCINGIYLFVFDEQVFSDMNREEFSAYINKITK